MSTLTYIYIYLYLDIYIYHFCIYISANWYSHLMIFMHVARFIVDLTALLVSEFWPTIGGCLRVVVRVIAVFLSVRQVGQDACDSPLPAGCV